MAKRTRCEASLAPVAGLERIKTWRGGGHTLHLFDTGQRDSRGQTKLGYVLKRGRVVVFCGVDFAGSPLHADDSLATVASLLSFLTCRRGDVEASYFDDYTPEQLAWRDSHAEALSHVVFELTERLERRRD